jgi:uncharacterized heparinase superfamily protein
MMSVDFKAYISVLRQFTKFTRRYYNTLKYLKCSQIIWRIWYKYRRIPNVSSFPLKTAIISNHWVEHAERQHTLVADTKFKFFGQTGDIVSEGWDNPSRSKLWRYNQNYFDDLNAKNSSNRIHWHLSLIDNWIRENNYGKGTGWEPYPTSLRIVNWVKFALRGGVLPLVAQESLALQARWLSLSIEWHILGNHLMSNAKALYFSSLFFQGVEAEQWRKTSLSIILDELEEQILADGGHFELSPMYHALVIEDFLDIINVSNCFGQSGDVSKIRDVLPKMLNWLRLMSHPDGQISFFNDCALNIAPDNQQIFDYANRLGIDLGKTEGSHFLQQSGYFRLETTNSVLIGDVGRIGPDYLPSHAHADTLSFEFSLFGQRVIVNSGTSEYGASSERLRQRGTNAHSTVSINHLNSSDVWSGFRVGNRAIPRDVTFRTCNNGATVCGSHDGYKEERGSPIHSRTWTLKLGNLTIDDVITGNSEKEVNVYFRLHPHISVVNGNKNSLLLTLQSGDVVRCNYEPDVDVFVEPTTWHPMFGTTVESLLIRFRKISNETVSLKTKFHWDG